MAKSKPKPKPREPIEPLLSLPPETERQVCKAIVDFGGQGTTLESAIGALVVGQHLGWRATRILHNANTYRKYEKILGLEFKDHCPERTHLSDKLQGIRINDAVGKYWDIVMGRYKVKDKGVLSDD